MSTQLHIKTFDELTKRELYEILRLRAAVFVVEQDCVYQDLDGLDYDAVHIFLTEEGRVRACARVYRRDADSNLWGIGRVVTDERRRGLGSQIFGAALRVVQEKAPTATVRIESQCQAQGFYEKFGFRPVSEPFMMDQLPHIKMEKRVTNDGDRE